MIIDMVLLCSGYCQQLKILVFFIGIMFFVSLKKDFNEENGMEIVYDKVKLVDILKFFDLN